MSLHKFPGGEGGPGMSPQEMQARMAAQLQQQAATAPSVFVSVVAKCGNRRLF